MIVMLAFGLSLGTFAGDTIAVRDSSRALDSPPWWEAGVLASGEAFTSRLSAWQWHSVAIRYRGRRASHGLEAFIARRHDAWNSGFALEETRVLGGGYGTIRAQIAPGATVVPRSDLSATLYHRISRGWELIPAARLMSFADDHVPIWGLGVGRYDGLWYLSGRVNGAIQAGEHGLTVTASARRYAVDGGSDYVDLVASHGREVAVLGPSLAALRMTSSAAIRGQRMLSRSLGASLALTYEANASLPDRRGAALSMFVRW